MAEHPRPRPDEGIIPDDLQLKYVEGESKPAPESGISPEDENRIAEYQAVRRKNARITERINRKN